MAITSYITSDEATLYYPNDQSFTSGQRTLALADSFNLVNAYVNSALAIPQIGTWDGQTTITAPSVLKRCQAQFYQYQLEFSNIGYTDELQALYDSTVKVLQGLTQNELSEPTGMTHAVGAGWHVVSASCTSNQGGVEVRGNAPTIKMFYRLVVTSASAKYPTGASGGISIDAYRSDSATARNTTAIYPKFDTWTHVDDGLEVRFDGQWTNNDSVRVVGVPHEQVNQTTASNTIKQSPVAY